MSSTSTTKSLEDEYLLLQDLYISGDDSQKLNVLHVLPQLLQYDSNATFVRIIPRIQQDLPTCSSEFHVAASKVFRSLIERRQLSVNLMDVVLDGVESKDSAISDAWMDTFLAVIPVLNEDQIRTQVLKFATIKSELSNSVYWRINSCKILGKLVIHPCIGSLDVKTNILPLVQSLCQDCVQDVRAAMCSQLHYVAQGLGENLVKSGLLPCLVELASDDNSCVRSSAIAAVVLIIPYLTHQTKIDIIVPLIKQLCEKSVKLGDVTFTTIAREFGRLLDSLQHDLDANDSLWFLMFFQTLMQCGGSHIQQLDEAVAEERLLCRQECAYNLPAVTNFTVSKLFPHLNLWHLIFHELVTDRSYIVRKMVANCISDIVAILGLQTKIIVPDIIRLLRDDHDEVLHVLVPHLGTILEALSNYNVLVKNEVLPTTLELTRAILKCQLDVFLSFNWRIQVCFLYQLERLPNCMASNFIFEHFTPVIFDVIIDARARPVQSQATKTLLIFLKYNVKEMQRKWMRKQMLEQLCHAHSCYMRQVYVQLCWHAMDVFSNRYFKEHFFVAILSLADDPVSNIRLSIAKMLPALSKMCSSSALDIDLQKRIDEVVVKFESNEKDRDIKEYLIGFKANINNQSNIPVVRGNEVVKVHQKDGVSKSGNGKNTSTKTESRITSLMLARKNISQQKIISTQAAPSPPPAVSTKSNKSGNSNNNMRFLEKHFYIDAGIILPSDKMKTKRSKNNAASSSSNSSLDTSAAKLRHCTSPDKLTAISVVENIKGLSLRDLKSSSSSSFDTASITTNITDDVKVNLRNLSKKKNKYSDDNGGGGGSSSGGGVSMKNNKENDAVAAAAATVRRSKRYSVSGTATITTSSFGSVAARNATNRRSLNLGQVAHNIVGGVGSSDLSKIPIVCLKKSKSNVDMKKKNKHNDCTIQATASTSSGGVERLKRIKSKLEQTGNSKTIIINNNINKAVITGSSSSNIIIKNTHINNNNNNNVPILIKSDMINKLSSSSSGLPVLKR